MGSAASGSVYRRSAASCGFQADRVGHSGLIVLVSSVATDVCVCAHSVNGT